MKFHQYQNTLIVELEENIIYANSSSIKEEIKTQIAPLTVPQVLIDLGKVQILDSSGLGLFISILSFTKQKAGMLKLCSVSPLLQKIFTMAKLHLIFDFYSDQKAALESFENDELQQDSLFSIRRD